MLKFDEKKLVDRINGALKLRPQVEEVVDRLWDGGLRNICFMGIGGTYASALDAVTAMLESTEQEEWLENNRAKVNTKLCVVIGSVMPLLFRENVPVPKWLKKLHLGGVYRWFLVMPYSHSLRRRIFHRKMDDYNTKKKFRR